MFESKLKLNFRSFSDSELEQITQLILQNMTGNPAFPSPVPTLAQLSTALDVYSAALLKAGNLGRIFVAEKNKARNDLEKLLTQLGLYVMFIAFGDLAILTSSGFPLAKTREPRYITNPGTVLLENGMNSGELVASVKASKAAKSYVHQIAADPLTPDTQWESTTSSRCTYTFKNLEPGKKYWVRVSVIGSGDQVACTADSSKFVQ
jgi:hypothetical protein